MPSDVEGFEADPDTPLDLAEVRFSAEADENIDAWLMRVGVASIILLIELSTFGGALVVL